MAKKRANGEGSTHQLPNGRWRASISVGGGKRAHFLGATRQDVSRQLRAALKARDDGLPTIAERQTVGQYLNSWLVAAKPTIRERTWVRYEQSVRLHALPALGKLYLDKLTPQHLQRLYADRLGAGASPTTVHHLHATLHKAFDQVVRWNLVGRNVADLVDPPRDRHFEIATLSPEQARVVLDAAAGNRLEALYVLALTTGMRQGEILGQRWRHVDLDGASLQVRGSLQRIEGKLTVTATKTEHSQRQVSLTSSAVAALRRHRVRQAEERLHLGAAWQGDDLVFTNEIGAPIGASRLLPPVAAAGRAAAHALPRSAPLCGDAPSRPGYAPEDRRGAARPLEDRHDDGPLQPRDADDAARSHPRHGGDPAPIVRIRPRQSARVAVTVALAPS
jgi:integrase